MSRHTLPTVAFLFSTLILSSTSNAAVVGSVFNPDDFAAIQPTLNVGPGDTLLFDTDALTLSINGGPALTGISSESQSTKAELAVFTFGSVDITPGATVTVTTGFWRRGLVLASQSDLSFGASLSLAGSSFDWGSPGIGGPGADHGGSGFPDSSPPGPSAGKGGWGANSMQLPSIAIGAGAPPLKSPSAGSGASYGGSGAFGAGAQAPGPVYGDAALYDLFGGSGGGGGRSNSPSSSGGGGGGGGGALELVAMDTLTVDGTLSADGGNGGRGIVGGGGGASGGGVLLAGNTLNFSGIINATGGDGAAPFGNGWGGGGGGGGRVAFYANSLNDTGTVDVTGGVAGIGVWGSGGAGAAGTYDPTQSFPHAIPEPATLALALLGWMSIGLRTPRRHLRDFKGDHTEDTGA